MTAAVVDTNVILVANGQHDDVSDGCIKVCISRLIDIMNNGLLVLDDQFEILKEYQNKTTPGASARPGDAFLKWALQNRATAGRVDQISIEQHSERGFADFPEDPDLANFDPPDRKFVAVARAHPQHPPIVQATDSKWLAWNAALSRHGVNVDFICPEDIHRFAGNLFAS